MPITSFMGRDRAEEKRLEWVTVFVIRPLALATAPSLEEVRTAPSPRHRVRNMMNLNRYPRLLCLASVRSKSAFQQNGNSPSRL